MLDVLLAPDIAAHRNGLAAGGMDGGADGLGRRDVAEIVEHHAIAARGGEPGDGRADAAAAAGDDKDLFGHDFPPVWESLRRVGWPRKTNCTR